MDFQSSMPIGFASMMAATVPHSTAIGGLSPRAVALPSSALTAFPSWMAGVRTSLRVASLWSSRAEASTQGPTAGGSAPTAGAPFFGLPSHFWSCSNCSSNQFAALAALLPARLRLGEVQGPCPEPGRPRGEPRPRRKERERDLRELLLLRRQRLMLRPRPRRPPPLLLCPQPLLLREQSLRLPLRPRRQLPRRWLRLERGLRCGSGPPGLHQSGSLVLPGGLHHSMRARAAGLTPPAAPVTRARKEAGGAEAHVVNHSFTAAPMKGHSRGGGPVCSVRTWGKQQTPSSPVGVTRRWKSFVTNSSVRTVLGESRLHQARFKVSSIHWRVKASKCATSLTG
mmetsp:Transcript_12546/g.34605  ORF Transcript_12546/g.34605 Transcript_12546/m.34605 type:complete len:340 (-) Transcript_12546:1019-2038(-)